MDKEPAGLKSEPWTFQHEKKLRDSGKRGVGGKASVMSGKSLIQGGESNFVESCWWHQVRRGLKIGHGFSSMEVMGHGHGLSEGGSTHLAESRKGEMG